METDSEVKKDVAEEETVSPTNVEMPTGAVGETKLPGKTTQWFVEIHNLDKSELKKLELQFNEKGCVGFGDLENGLACAYFATEKRMKEALTSCSYPAPAACLTTRPRWSACVTGDLGNTAAEVLRAVKKACPAANAYSLQLGALTQALTHPQIYTADEAGLQALLQLKGVAVNGKHHHILSPADYLYWFTLLLCCPGSERMHRRTLKLEMERLLEVNNIDGPLLHLEGSTFALKLATKGASKAARNALHMSELESGERLLAFRYRRLYGCRITGLPAGTEQTDLDRLLQGLSTLAVVPALDRGQAFVYLFSSNALKELVGRDRPVVRDREVTIAAAEFTDALTRQRETFPRTEEAAGDKDRVGDEKQDEHGGATKGKEGAEDGEEEPALAEPQRWEEQPLCCVVTGLTKAALRSGLDPLLQGIPVLSVVQQAQHAEVFLPSKAAQQQLLLRHQTVIKKRRVCIHIRDDTALSDTSDDTEEEEAESDGSSMSETSQHSPSPVTTQKRKKMRVTLRPHQR